MCVCVFVCVCVCVCMYVFIVTYVRFSWLNNVSTAITMDSAKLLHFLSNATMETEMSHCYMLHFLSNTRIEAETFRLLWRGYIKVSWNEKVSSLVVLESLKSSDLVRSAIDCNWRLCQGTSRGSTCVQRVVTNSCVLNFECNKFPSWNRTRVR
jgi:hypothetical protein